MNMRQIILMSMFLILLTTICYASDPDLYYKYGDTIDFKLPCYDSVTGYCDASTTCNLTIVDHRDVLLINNQAMTRNGGYYNYTFSPTTLGDYKFFIMCTDGSEMGASGYKVQINNQGHKIENLLPYVLFFFVIIILTIGLIGIVGMIEPSLMVGGVLLLSFEFNWLFFYMYMNSIGLNLIFFALYRTLLVINSAIFILGFFWLTIYIFNYLFGRKKRSKGFKDTF